MFKKRKIEHGRQNAKHFYFMSLKADEYIDASQKGNVARFMNHSCKPNCILHKWVVGAGLRVGIFTLRDILDGEELTFDYKFEQYGYRHTNAATMLKSAIVEKTAALVLSEEPKRPMMKLRLTAGRKKWPMKISTWTRKQTVSPPA